ncbi:hypothetical protein [Winogradskyella sp.]|uniref:hypothetical protein n=1 Tax=Winogradskyella sp. TaxID=1883156 RepID=UPI003F6C8C86
MNRFSLFIFTVLLISCGVQKKAVTPEMATKFSPKINEINNAEIGITLVTKEKGRFNDAIEITKEFKTKVGYDLKTIAAGTVFINYHYTNKYNLYSNPNFRTFGIAIPRNGDNTIIYNTNSDPNGIYTSRMGSNNVVFIPLKEKIEFKKILFPDKQKDYFKQEFIYNGRVSDAIKFTYREYADNYARPAFTQDLQYDLSESEIIGFRGLRIEVIDATNTKIEYKVLNHFD